MVIQKFLNEIPTPQIFTNIIILIPPLPSPFCFNLVPLQSTGLNLIRPSLPLRCKSESIIFLSPMFADIFLLNSLLISESKEVILRRANEIVDMVESRTSTTVYLVNFLCTIILFFCQYFFIFL